MIIYRSSIFALKKDGVAPPPRGISAVAVSPSEKLPFGIVVEIGMAVVNVSTVAAP